MESGAEEETDSFESRPRGIDMPMEQRRLLARVRKGDRRALECLLLRHLTWLARIAYRLSRRRGDPDDVVQETIVAVIGKLPHLVARSSFRAYLFGEAQNAARRVAGEQTGHYEGFDPANDAPYDANVSLQEEDIAAALADLAPEHREVVLLHHVRGLTLEETAHALGIPKGTVASRLHRATRAARIDPRVLRYFES